MRGGGRLGFVVGDTIERGGTRVDTDGRTTEVGGDCAVFRVRRMKYVAEGMTDWGHGSSRGTG